MKLKITNLGTVKFEDGSEIKLEKFLKKLERKITKEICSVECGSQENKFNIIYMGKNYVLEVDKDNISEEEYENITSRLKELVDISDNIKKNKKIIEDAENGIIPNDAAKIIYLDELRNRKKFLNAVRRYKKEMHKEISPSVIFTYEIFYALIGFLVGGIPSIIVRDLQASLIFATIGFSIIPSCECCCIILDYALGKKIVKHKIKELEKQLGEINIMAKPKDSSSESEKQDKTSTSEFKDTIHAKIENLLKSINSLNDTVEKERLKGILRSILEYYGNYLDLIDKVGSKELSVSRCKSIADLRAMLIKKLVGRLEEILTNVAAYIDEMLNEQTTRLERETEQYLLNQRLDPVVIDSKEIDGVLEERKESQIPEIAGRGPRAKTYIQINPNEG